MKKIAALAIATILMMTGCKSAFTPHAETRTRLIDSISEGEGGTASEDELIFYNGAVAFSQLRGLYIPEIWARGTFSVEYTNKDDTNRREYGDVLLSFDRPHNVAIVFQKLGENVAWVGSNRSEFWGIAKPPSRANDIASIRGWRCRHENINKINISDTANLYIAPVDPRLLHALFGFDMLPSNINFPASTMPAGLSVGLVNSDSFSLISNHDSGTSTRVYDNSNFSLTDYIYKDEDNKLITSIKYENFIHINTYPGGDLWAPVNLPESLDDLDKTNFFLLASRITIRSDVYAFTAVFDLDEISIFNVSKQSPRDSLFQFNTVARSMNLDPENTTLLDLGFR